MTFGGTLREKAALAAVGGAALYALTAVWWFTSCSRTWADARRRLERSRETYAREAKMISERKEWDERYDEEASQIPVVEAGQGSDTVWMGVVDRIARENNIFITERKPGREEETGDMEQMTVDIRWTGAVESLVKFMYGLENAPGGKFDVQSLNFSPGKRKGYMGGSMTLACIYKRK